MKSKKFSFFLISIFSLMLICMNTIVAQKVFEGVVEYKITGKDDVTNVKYFSKADMLRMEVAGDASNPMASGAFIFNKDNMIILMPEQKMYMEFPVNMAENMMGGQKEEIEEPDDLGEPVVTDETKTILGYTCKKWFFSSSEGDLEMWLTDGLGTFMGTENPMGGGIPSWYDKYAGEGMFPLIMIMKDKSGKEEFRMEAVNVNEGGVTDDMFKAPTGWNKMDMGGMQ